MTWPGLPARRVDQRRAPGVPATAPGSSSVVRARFVIVSGPGDGVFVYAPGTTPGLGNSPIAWMGGGLVDPFGNVLPSTTGVAASGTFQAGDTIINASGIYVYSGTPGPGNLSVSTVPGAAGGTDPFGNTTDPGVTAYGPSISAQLYAGQNNFYSFVANAGVSVQMNASGALVYVGITGGYVQYSVPVAFSPGIAAPAKPSSGMTAYPDTAGNLDYVNSGDGNTYSTGRYTNPTAGTVTINSTSAITILSAPVQAGKYRVSLKIVYAGGATASSAILSMANGTATVSNTLGVLRRARGSTNADNVLPVNQGSALGNLSLAFNAAELETYEFDGIITFSAAGTLVVTGAETTSGDTWAVGTNSFVDLMPVSH